MPNEKSEWRYFVLASICTLPFVALALAWVIATGFNLPKLLSLLRFSIFGFSPFFAIAGFLGLLASVFALKKQPELMPILISYIAIIIAGVLIVMLNLGSF
jgi:hypothetical protein